MFKPRTKKKSLRKKQMTQQQQERQMPILKSPREIQIMREAGRIVARVHQALRKTVEPGISTWDLEQVAVEVLHKYNSTSGFMGYRGFPGQICVSVNNELVHGIPSKKRILKQGDIVSIDVGSRYRGFIGDSAWSYPVGKINEKAEKLMKVTEESLYAGIKQAVPGKRIVDISRSIQRHVERNDLHVVRGYTGHGVGRQMHESPQVLNYVTQDADAGYVLRPGLVIAIEPMVQVGTWKTKVLKDKWTVVSKDGSPAAHFEHTVAITNNGPEILTRP